ncbi:MAG: serine/threonine-protein kinase [Pseudomonadota bacterium]
MTDALDTWRAADACLSELLEHPESTWAARIDALALSSDVRDCLDRLIKATTGRGVLDTEVALANEAKFATDHLVGERFGPWQLDAEIGRGGMAVVYQAHRTGVDFEQLAAVKLLPRGSAGQEHFLREQAVLAQLEHPFIARFLDGGVAVDGTPWIAMERVDGNAIDQATEGWESADIVSLMRRVIEAVAFAHRHLIIHRDLKPSNVLVDDSRRPRLLDFGIAKLLNDHEQQQATRVMTPEFAAPEQFSGASVSTATDVYGLGALLHRLLTGQPPRSRTGERALKLGSIGNADLRAIVEKSLRKDPMHRYASADALNADLLRWQQREPVLARPDSRRYRLSRWFQRHRASAIGGSLVLLAIVIGTIGVAWQAQRTAEQARLVSTQNAVLRDLLGSPRRTQRGRQVLMADVVADSLDVIMQRMPEPSRERALLLSDFALTLDHLAQHEQANEFRQQIIADLQAAAPNDRRRLIEARENLAYSMLNAEQTEAAAALLNELVVDAESLLPANDELHASIAMYRYMANRLGGAETKTELAEVALAVGERVTWADHEAESNYRSARLQVLNDLGRFDQASDEAVALLEWTDARFDQQYGHSLAVIEAGIPSLARAGRLKEASLMAARGVALAREWLGEHDRVTFNLRNSLATILQEQGRSEEAIAIYTVQLEVLDQAEGLSPLFRPQTYGNLAVAHLEDGRYELASGYLETALALYEEADAINTPAAYLTMVNLAELQVFADQPHAALQHADRAVNGFTALLGPEHPITTSSRCVRGGAQLALGNMDAALSDLDGMPSKLAAAFGEDDVNVMNARAWLASALAGTGRYQEAIEQAQRAHAWRLQQYGADHPRTRAVAAMLMAWNEST